MKKSYIFISILIIFIIFVFVLSPQKYVLAFSDGLLVWATILIPTLFPFLFFTKILTDLGVINTLTSKFNFTKVLFKTPPISSYAFVISILSGYPVGAKVVSDLYQKNLISKNDAFKISTFTSNSGPMFIYGTVGIGLLFSKTIGLILLFSHIFGAILNGVLYRNHVEDKKIKQYNFQPPESKQFSVGDSMFDSITSILLIGGFVCIFFVVIEILNSIGLISGIAIFFENLFNISPDITTSIFNGLIEMTHGCIDISASPHDIKIISIICCFLITFGGVATMVQAYVFLQKIGMKFSFFIKQKITHTILSTSICAGFMFLFF